MSRVVRIGIIGGNGWLGGAIAKAIVAAGILEPTQLTLSGRSGRRGSSLPGVNWTRDNNELVDHSDVIVLSVRPQQFEGVAIKADGKLVLSVMAGVPAAVVSAHTQAARIVRAMPNAAASLRKSFTPWFATAAATNQDKAFAQRFFSACGEAEQVQQESDIDYCAGLTGSGAAFPALLAQAMIEAALSRGFSPSFARRAAIGVVAGASQLLRADDGDPSQIVQEMIEYRGTTAAALTAMRTHGFVDAVHAGLESAARAAADIAAG
jgi:pyrroline-5-carboxylate reductase